MTSNCKIADAIRDCMEEILGKKTTVIPTDDLIYTTSKKYGISFDRIVEIGGWQKPSMVPFHSNITAPYCGRPTEMGKRLK